MKKVTRDNERTEKRPRNAKRADGKSPSDFSSERDFKGRKSFGDSNDRRSFGDKKAFGDRPFGEKKNFGDRKSFGDKRSFDDRKPFGEKKNFGDRKFEDRKPFGERRSFDDRKSFGEKRSFDDRKSFGERKSFDDRKSFGERKLFDDRKPFGERRSFDDRKPFGEKKNFGDRKFEDRKSFGDRKSFDDRKPFGEKRNFGDRKFDDRKSDNFKSRNFEAPLNEQDQEFGKRKFGKRKKDEPFEYGATVKPQKRPDYSEEKLLNSLSPKQKAKVEAKEEKNSSLVRLNRFIANAGLCSRREADDLIESGQITVNGKTITEMGYQVKPTDVVKYGRKVLNREKLVYVLLNKPKDFITTTEDPEGRRTVMELVSKACPERIYPVGRLDRATTGLLLFTNDGELAEKLSHPSNEIRKIYQAEIDKPITKEDFEKLVSGVELEDGFVKPDEVSIITPDQQVIGIEIHSGKNRVVRRIFEALGYEVTKLDRTTYAGLTKKDLPRGNWRFLTEKEVIRLKYMI